MKAKKKQTLPFYLRQVQEVCTMLSEKQYLLFLKRLEIANIKVALVEFCSYTPAETTKLLELYAQKMQELKELEKI